MDIATQLQTIRENLPLRIRSGGQGGLTTADDVLEYEFSVLDVLDVLATLSRGNRIWSFELGGGPPDPAGAWQEGDLYLDAGGQVPGGNLWQYVDGEWSLLFDLRGRDGSQILGGAGAPANVLGNVGDWYFQYGAAAWEKTGNGWVNRFALGAGTALPAQAGNGGKVLATDGTTAGWVVPASGLPSQAGNIGKFLTTDGTVASWVGSNLGSLSGLLTTVKSSAVAAINELFGLVTNNRSDIGTLASLSTTNKGNLVGAINEVRGVLPLTAERTAAYTLTLADMGCLVPVNSSSAVVVTVPANTFPAGAVVQVRQRGTGTVSIAFATGTSGNAYPTGANKCAGQHAEIGLHHIAGDVFNLASATI